MGGANLGYHHNLLSASPSINYVDKSQVRISQEMVFLLKMV